MSDPGGAERDHTGGLRRLDASDGSRFPVRDAEGLELCLRLIDKSYVLIAPRGRGKGNSAGTRRR